MNNHLKYTLLIFDWDGTLIDSQARIVSSFQGATRDLGLRIPSSSSVRDIIGLGLPEAIMTVMPECTEQERQSIRDSYSRHYNEIDHTPTALFEGVLDGLCKLSDAGFRLAIATGKSRRGLDKVLNDTGLSPFFEISRCADETQSKPDPLMIDEILAKTGVSRTNAVMIGDTTYDLEMAQAAGIDSIAVTYGVHSRGRLEIFEPTTFVKDFNELLAWLIRSECGK